MCIRDSYLPYSPEYGTIGVDGRLLGKLCEGTGGVFSPDPESISRPTRSKSFLPRPIWEVLILASLAFFLAEMVVRRVGFKGLKAVPKAKIGRVERIREERSVSSAYIVRLMNAKRSNPTPP